MTARARHLTSRNTRSWTALVALHPHVHPVIYLRLFAHHNGAGSRALRALRRPVRAHTRARAFAPSAIPAAVLLAVALSRLSTQSYRRCCERRYHPECLSSWAHHSVRSFHAFGNAHPKHACHIACPKWRIRLLRVDLPAWTACHSRLALCIMTMITTASILIRQGRVAHGGHLFRNTSLTPCLLRAHPVPPSSLPCRFVHAVYNASRSQKPALPTEMTGGSVSRARRVTDGTRVSTSRWPVKIEVQLFNLHPAHSQP